MKLVKFELPPVLRGDSFISGVIIGCFGREGQIKRKNIVFAAVLILLQFRCALLQARPITANQAKKVVTGWLKADALPLGKMLGRRGMKVQTFTDDSGEPIYYIVHLRAGGFVIVSANDLIEPIIGFADDGIFDPSPDNPLGALVTGDLKSRAARIRDTFRLQTVAKKKTFSGNN